MPTSCKLYIEDDMPASVQVAPGHSDATSRVIFSVSGQGPDKLILWGATWHENVNCKTKPWWSETGLWRSSHLQKTLLRRCHCKRLQRVDRVTDCTGHDDIIDLRAFLAMNGSNICRQRRYSLQCRLDERKIRMRTIVRIVQITRMLAERLPPRPENGMKPMAVSQSYSYYECRSDLSSITRWRET